MENISAACLTSNIEHSTLNTEVANSLEPSSSPSKLNVRRSMFDVYLLKRLRENDSQKGP